MSIEVIALEHFSALPQTEIKLSRKTCPFNAVFHSFLSDYSKQYAVTTTSRSKLLIEPFKKSVDVRIKYNMGKY